MFSVSIPPAATPSVAVPDRDRRQLLSRLVRYQYSPWGIPVNGATVMSGHSIWEVGDKTAPKSFVSSRKDLLYKPARM